VQTSIALTNFSWPAADPIPERLAEIIEAADRGGIDTVWVSDHLLQAVPGVGLDEPWLEATTTLGFLAARSRRVRLGILVAAATLRAPALLVKAITTLDVLSGGRAWLGVGSGRLEQDADAFGLTMPTAAEAFALLEDTLRLAHHMWSGDTSRFEGRSLTAERPVGSPRPITQPHPPILVGGTGETRTLPLVARYGDACNLFDIPDGGVTIRRKLAVLADHCAAAGRPVDDIETTVSTWLQVDDTADTFAERARALVDLGIDHLVVLTPEAWTPDRLDVLGEAAATIDAQQGRT
jgi:alkanesulfonate monooxygenase SsuD/methylene tetrahydromethanopterin reductase-like flavin-dependent oxidoreductase (luciferase family)